MSLRLLVLLSVTVTAVLGHGRVLQPPGRGTAWRFGFNVEPDYDDDGLNCGGFHHQWGVHDGKCGICGDPFDASVPRPHELGGKYGKGVIVADYLAGSLINVTIQLTAYHKGYWQLNLCPDPENNEQDCFNEYPLELADGSTKYYPDAAENIYEVTYRLPEGLICDHCVLQWIYTAGNNWGICDDGTGATGCGNQETFWSCSDISIGFSETKQPSRSMQLEETPSILFFILKHGYFDAKQGLLHLLRKTLVRPHKNLTKIARYEYNHKRRKKKVAEKMKQKKKVRYWR